MTPLALEECHLYWEGKRGYDERGEESEETGRKGEQDGWEERERKGEEDGREEIATKQ